MHTYLFELRGQIDVEDLNMLSPHQMNVLPSPPAVTRFSICTDQSGMIGMIQHLHNLGLTIQSIILQTAEPNARVLAEAKTKEVHHG